MAEFVMPALGADMQAGTLLQWLKRPGDAVAKGDIVAVVHTDKADVEVEVFTSGVIEELLVEPGAEVPVGTVLAVIHKDGAPAPRAEAPAAPPPEGAPAHVVISPFRTAARRGARTRTCGDPRLGASRTDPAQGRRGGGRSPEGRRRTDAVGPGADSRAGGRAAEACGSGGRAQRCHAARDRRRDEPLQA